MFYLDNNRLRCLEAKSGKLRWASPFRTEGAFIRSYAPTVVIGKDGVAYLKVDQHALDEEALNALAAPEA